MTILLTRIQPQNKQGCPLPTNLHPLPSAPEFPLFPGPQRFTPLLLYYSAAKPLQSCPTLCDPTDGSPPGSPIPGILQARTLEWVAISFSNAWKWKVKVKLISRVWLFTTPWTAAYQAPPSIGFSRQEYWSGFPLPSPLYYSIPITLLLQDTCAISTTS